MSIFVQTNTYPVLTLKHPVHFVKVYIFDNLKFMQKLVFKLLFVHPIQYNQINCSSQCNVTDKPIVTLLENLLSISLYRFSLTPF